MKLSMSRDILVYLDDIQESCKKVLRYTRDMNHKQFIQDDKTYDAVVRNLEIIGEAVKHVPENFRHRYPDVEWRKIAGLRDIVAHVYFGINDEIVWDVVENKIPQLLEQISGILEQEQKV